LELFVRILPGVLLQVFLIIVDSFEIVVAEDRGLICVASDQNWDAHLLPLCEDLRRLRGDNPAINDSVEVKPRVLFPCCQDLIGWHLAQLPQISGSAGNPKILCQPLS
jgi:hypothetical protein